MLLKQNCNFLDLYFDDIQYKKFSHRVLPEEDCGTLRPPGIYLTHLVILVLGPVDPVLPFHQHLGLADHKDL